MRYFKAIIFFSRHTLKHKGRANTNVIAAASANLKKILTFVIKTNDIK